MRILTVLLMFLLAGCAATQPSIYAKSHNDIPYEEVLQNFESYEQQTVRWGGMIAHVANYENFSELTIVQFDAVWRSHLNRKKCWPVYCSQ